MARVVIADDHPLLRRALSRSLRFAGLEVVADAANCSETISAVREHQPDVLSLDFLMPDGNAFGVLGALRAFDTKPQVVVYTGENDDDLRQTLISEGAERSGWQDHGFASHRNSRHA